jgi:branched-chain amino acid transport system permease protein
MLTYLILGLMTSGVTITFAVGFQLVFSTTDIFHFVYAALYTLGAYVVFSISRDHVPLLLAGVIAVVAVGVVSAAIELVVYRPMRRRHAERLAILIASLGMLTILQGIMAIVWGNVTLIIPTPAALRGGIMLFGTQVPMIDVAEMVAATVIFLAIKVFVLRHPIGQIMRAVADDPARARIIGIPVDRTYLYAFIVGGAVLVPMAVLDGMNVGITPYASTDTFLLASIVVFVGGIGSLGGTFIASLAIGMISGALLNAVPSEWITAATYAVLTAAILIRPQGIAGWAERQGAV